MRFVVLSLSALLAVTGCSMKPRYEAPAPVIKSDGRQSQVLSPMEKPKPRQEGQVEITALAEPAVPAVMQEQSSAQPVTAQPAQNRAVELLQERAADQLKQGDYASAAKSLERALSIEPNNALTWNHLAHLREKEKKYDIAAEIAARSNSLAASGQDNLKKDNWLLISRARSQLGDRTGAEQAKKEAGLLN